MLVALALAIAPSEASQDGAPQVSASLAYDGESRSRLVLSYTVGGSVSVRRLQIILKQPAGSMTVSGSSPAASCSTFMAGDTPGANCDFPGDVAPGTSGTLLFDLPGPYTENGGADLRAYPSGSGAPGNPVDVGGPAEPSSGGGQTQSKAADLTLEMAAAVVPDSRAAGLVIVDDRGYDQLGVPDGVTDLVWVTIRTIARNNGPDRAEGISIAIDPPVVPSTSGEKWVISHDCPPFRDFRIQGILTPATLECGSLAPTLFTEPFYSRILIWGPGVVSQSATVRATTRDPGPAVNTASAELQLADLPDTTTTKLLPLPDGLRLRGGAQRVRSMYLAVQKGSGTVGRSAAAGCRWLKRPSGGFVKDPGACDAPRWLKAKGTRRWRLALPSLPPGRYVAYARARRGALSEASFDKRDGNKLAFRVK